MVYYTEKYAVLIFAGKNKNIVTFIINNFIKITLR
jgi:hypothetical protein